MLTSSQAISHVRSFNSSANYVFLGQVFDYNPNDYPPLQPESEQATNNLLGEQNHELQFDSNFECGNLLFAFQDVEVPHEYHLVLHNDTNTRGYTQWFYFSVENHQGATVKFRIVNLVMSSPYVDQTIVVVCRGNEAVAALYIRS